jgi:hypothetical protein
MLKLDRAVSIDSTSTEGRDVKLGHLIRESSFSKEGFFMIQVVVFIIQGHIIQ